MDEGRPLGVRAAAKARTRRNLIEAARRLFMERGYDGATVRDIAAAAGLSTGAVFASFADKAELFDDVLQADSELQIEVMAKAAAESGTMRERLVRVLSAGYAYQLDQIELLRAALSVSWSQGLSGELGDRPIRKAATEMIREVLDRGVSAGELGATCDLELFTDTVWDLFVENYRQALFKRLDMDQLTARLKRQIDFLMNGAANS
jgi:AcrR family transcriptional regulator